MFLIVPGGVLGTVLASFWTPFGVLWGPWERVWLRFGWLLRSSGDPKGALARSWVSFGGSGDVLGTLFSLLEGSWGGFGRGRWVLWVFLGCLGARLLVLNGGITHFL